MLGYSPDSLGMVAHPAVAQVQGQGKGDQYEQQRGGPSRPTLHEAEASSQKVPYQDGRGGPGRPSEDVVEEEGPPAHPAHARDQRPEDPQTRYEAGQEDGLAPLVVEELLCPA